MELEVPPIMNAKKYRGLSPLKQEEYLERKIREIVNMNSHGVTIPDITQNTPFTRASVIKHLEKMVSSRDAYKIRRGRMSIYYPNGRVVHPEDTCITDTSSGSRYRATFLNNDFGEFIFLEDLNESIVAGGSILIKREDLNEFLQFLKEVIRRKDLHENPKNRISL